MSNIDWTNFEKDLENRRDKIEKAWEQDIQKAQKDTSHLIKKQVWVTRGGRTFQQTVYVSKETGEKVEIEPGMEISPDFNGMKISKYSNKAMLLSGNTSGNLALLREIKQETGLGIWNNQLGGWIWPISSMDKVLGYIYSKVSSNEEMKDDSEIKEDILKLKNAYKIGTKVQGNKQNGEIVDFHITDNYILYDVKTEDGKVYKDIKESLIKVLPETDDKKIVELINSAVPENRNTVEIQINGTTESPKTVDEVVKEEIKKSEPEVKPIGEDYKPSKTSVLIGDKKLEINDYTDVPAIQITLPKDKGILEKPKPNYIPPIDEKNFLKKGLFFDAYKLGEDKYLVALDGYMRGGVKQNYTMQGVESKNVTIEDSNFAVMSLDLLTATTKYYQSRAKETNKRSYEALGRKVKRLSALSENRANYSHMDLFNDMNPFMDKREVNKLFWKEKRELFADIKQKGVDMELQLEDLENSYSKGQETSYGNSGVKDDLLKEYGVRVKRQNGDEIKPEEINQIKEGLSSVYSVFGNRKEMAEKWGLKISHSGEKMMHARKALGLFFPHYNAIGVSFGSKELSGGFILAHEFGHFMDYWVGKKNGSHYGSDKQGSLENQIAKTFKKSCNKLSDSAYWGRTCENFARSMEQYHAYKTDSNGYLGYTKDNNYASKEKFETLIVPLVEKFLQENNDLLKSVKINIL